MGGVSKNYIASQLNKFVYVYDKRVPTRGMDFSMTGVLTREGYDFQLGGNIRSIERPRNVNTTGSQYDH